MDTQGVYTWDYWLRHCTLHTALRRFRASPTAPLHRTILRSIWSSMAAAIALEIIASLFSRRHCRHAKAGAGACCSLWIHKVLIRGITNTQSPTYNIWGCRASPPHLSNYKPSSDSFALVTNSVKGHFHSMWCLHSEMGCGLRLTTPLLAKTTKSLLAPFNREHMQVQISFVGR